MEQLAKVENVRHVHEVSTVCARGKLHITLHAIVDPTLSVEKAHDIADQIEKKMYAAIRQLEHVTVHIEPAGEVRVGELATTK